MESYLTIWLVLNFSKLNKLLSNNEWNVFVYSFLCSRIKLLMEDYKLNFVNHWLQAITYLLPWRGVWMWRRRLLAWEEECVSVCSVLLDNVDLQDIITDRWIWLLDPVNGYSVKGTYHFLTSVDEPLARGMFDDVWHKYVPLKVSLFSWRLLCNNKMY